MGAQFIVLALAFILFVIGGFAGFSTNTTVTRTNWISLGLAALVLGLYLMGKA